MKRSKPVTICNKCGAPGSSKQLTYGKCERMAGGVICNGTNQSAILENDWLECPSCAATGLERDKRCSQCEGTGWLFARS